MVAGQQDLRNSPPPEFGRACVVRVLHAAVETRRERLPVQALGIAEGAGQAPGQGIDHRHGCHLAPRENEGAQADAVVGEVIMHPLVEALVPAAQQGEGRQGREFPGHGIVERTATRRQHHHAPVVTHMVGGNAVHRLKRGRHDVRGCSVKLTTERAETDPKVFTKIHMHFTVTGKGIPPAAVERAIAMSHDKYCSASIMLGKTADITTGYEVLEA